MRWLAKLIYFKLLGWQVSGFTEINSIKKVVIIGAPHTHWMDFPISVLVRSVLGVKTNYVGKKSLFKWPYGWFFRWLGGSPVVRKSNENQVQAIARIFNEKEEFRIALAPEGTRKKVDKWRTGFYYIAKTANVPIIMFTLDFENKTNHFSNPFYPTDEVDADFKVIMEFYKDVKGKIPEYS